MLESFEYGSLNSKQSKRINSIQYTWIVWPLGLQIEWMDQYTYIPYVSMAFLFLYFMVDWFFEIDPDKHRWKCNFDHIPIWKYENYS